jgi:single-stranded DNA-binding protein
MNTRNIVALTGYMPDPEKMGKAVQYREGDDKKKSFYRGKITIRRAFKDKEGDYRYDWIPFTCFGPNADFINKYVHAGDIIQIHGELQISDNYEDKDGNTVYGTPFVLADNVSIIHSADNGENNTRSNGGSNGGSTKSASKGSNNPLAKLRNKKSA